MGHRNAGLKPYCASTPPLCIDLGTRCRYAPTLDFGQLALAAVILRIM
jgi:hypothetical protein